MRAFMMEYQLTIEAIRRRAEALSGDREIVSRGQDLRLHRYRYADMIERSGRLGVALQRLGVRPGDRVAALAWNTHEHFEAYFAVPCIGAVLHTLNFRLSPDDLIHIINHAEDSAILVDEGLLPLFAQLRDRTRIDHVIVFGSNSNPYIPYEQLIADADPAAAAAVALHEQDAASMCYSSGTTGRPKGIMYSHRAVALQSLNWAVADGAGLGARDVVLAAIPMAHINGWCLPYAAALAGAKLVLPGTALRARDILDFIASERVTISGGVPTIWQGVLHELDRNPGAYDVRSLNRLIVGGSGVPRALIEGYQERYGVRVRQAWGMTETTSLATVCDVTPDVAKEPADRQYDWRMRQGLPLPFVEIRACAESGLVPWDGQTLGELEIRGPAVAQAYYASKDLADAHTHDGWFKTGDIVTIDPNGFISVRDRARDLIKSGGEWICSVAIEVALMDHPAVAEAAVVAVPDAHWGERPLAVVVRKPDTAVTADELREFLKPQFVKWWLPDAFEFVEAIPQTATGKFWKMVLRDRYVGAEREQVEG